MERRLYWKFSQPICCSYNSQSNEENDNGDETDNGDEIQDDETASDENDEQEDENEEDEWESASEASDASDERFDFIAFIDSLFMESSGEWVDVDQDEESKSPVPAAGIYFLLESEN